MSYLTKKRMLLLSYLSLWTLFFLGSFLSLSHTSPLSALPSFPILATNLLSKEPQSILSPPTNSTPAQVQQITYLPLGDSITESTCWRSLLFSSLSPLSTLNITFTGSRTFLPKNCPHQNPDTNTPPLPTPFLHEGESGLPASRLAYANPPRVPKIFQDHPADIVSIMLGTNDIVLLQLSPAQILAALKEIVSQIQTSTPQTEIIVGTLLPIARPPAVRPDHEEVDPAAAVAEAVNVLIREWVEDENSGLYLLDLFVGIKPAEDLKDGVHPSVSGDVKISERMYAALVRVAEDIVRERERNGDGDGESERNPTEDDPRALGEGYPR